jgi:hypothetical protein
MFREISDLDLFYFKQTSPYGLGLYKKILVRYFSVQTSRSVKEERNVLSQTPFNLSVAVLPFARKFPCKRKFWYLQGNKIDKEMAKEI